MIGDWYFDAVYLFAFGFGFLFARADFVWDAMSRVRWWTLGLAVSLYASSVLWRLVHVPGTPALYAVVVNFLFGYGVYQWACIATVLGFARRWLNRDGQLRRYLTEAVFPFYIVHQTAIIVLAHALREQRLPAPVEAAVVIAGTAATCLLTFEVVRRVGWLRPLFGLRPFPGKAVAHPAPATPGG